MAFAPKFVDLVRNTTTTVGTGPIALGAAVDGYTGFAQACAAGDQFYYCIQGIDRPTEREVGRGTMQADGTIAREPIEGGLTNFRSGSKTIALVAAAEWYGKVSAGSGAVATRGELAALETAAGKMAILGEVGRAGLFRFDATNLASRVAADPMQGVHVAPANDPTGASGAWVRQYDGAINVRWFGAKGDNASDDAPAINAAIALSKAMGHAGAYSIGGAAVYLPAASYYCASTIDWNHTLRLFGDGGGDAGGDPTILRFAAGQTGLRLQHIDTSGAATIDGTNHSQAAGSIIEHLVVQGGYGSWAATPEGEHHGVHSKVRLTCRNVSVSGFQGDGFRIVADSGGGGATRGNANGFNLDKCAAYGCRNGLYIEGGDTNAGTTNGFNASYNRRWGIFDRSFLGNSHIGPHADGNGFTDPDATPTIVVHSGKRYVVKIGQEAGAATNPPSGTASDNNWWIYCYDGGVAPGFPAWTSGIVVRSGGSYGGDNLNAVSTFIGAYHENGQGVGQLGQNMLAVGGNCPIKGPWVRGALNAVSFGSTAQFEALTRFYGPEGDWGGTALDRTDRFYSANGYATNCYMGAGLSFAGGTRFNSYYSGMISNGEIRFMIGPQFSYSDVAKIDAGGLFLMKDGAKLGYQTGTGGAVVQATSKATGVTLSKSNGRVTMNGASLAANAAVSFVLTNSAIGAGDVVLVSISGGATAGAYCASVDQVAAGSCRISLRNMSAAALAETVVLNVAIISAVAA